MKRILNCLRAAGLAVTVAGAALGFAAATPAAAEPALWQAQAQSGGGTAYMFGTFHLLKPDVVWDTPKVEKAFADASELWLEIKDIDNPQAMQGLVAQLGLDKDHPLSTKLSPADKALLDKDSAAVGVPAGAFEPCRPWFVALQMSLVPLLKAGYQAQSGVDIALKAKADARKETVNAFETVEQQLHFFADLPPAIELAYLHDTLVEFDPSLVDFNRAAAAWAAGDVDGIDKVLMSEMRRDSPEVYAVLIKRRNENIADQIAARLAKGGTIFVAVGAGHLTGPDSIQAALERRGVHVKRL